jgi:hypothetical protein
MYQKIDPSVESDTEVSGGGEGLSVTVWIVEKLINCALTLSGDLLQFKGPTDVSEDRPKCGK